MEYRQSNCCSTRTKNISSKRVQCLQPCIEKSSELIQVSSSWLFTIFAIIFFYIDIDCCTYSCRMHNHQWPDAVCKNEDHPRNRYTNTHVNVCLIKCQWVHWSSSMANNSDIVVARISLIARSWAEIWATEYVLVSLHSICQCEIIKCKCVCVSAILYSSASHSQHTGLYVHMCMCVCVVCSVGSQKHLSYSLFICNVLLFSFFLHWFFFSLTSYSE